MRAVVQRLQLLSVLALAASSVGCSFVLDLRDCEVDEHCASGRCVDGMCEATLDEVRVTANVSEDVVWGDDSSTYVLDQIVFVEPGATLTIRSGTTILGEEGSALVVEAGGRLISRGTEFEPVVFTSSKPEGNRVPGDWGGVALLGRAPTNEQGPVLEGVAEVDRAGYGGNEDDWSCGVLEYTRIEFAGFPLEQDKELNGLTLGGCGSGTLIDYVQIHQGLDDGIEFFGGSVNVRHLVVTRAQDDSIDWDEGWTGNAQFVAVQQDSGGDNGIEASSNGDDGDASPRANPSLWNVTLIGSGGEGSQRAMTLKDGTAGSLNNFLIMGHPIEGVDVQDAETVAQLEGESLSINHSLFYAIGPGGEQYFPNPEDEIEMMPDDGRDDDEGFDEAMFFMGVDTLEFGTNPELNGPFNLSNPGWVPGGVVNSIGATPPSGLFDGIDEQATYAGAFKPGDLPWTNNWTAYPAD